MNNNDILIRLRYAFDMKDTEMVEIFKLGGTTITKEEVQKMLIKFKEDINSNTEKKTDFKDCAESIKCNNSTLESFLNGFIIYKRGKLEQEQDQQSKPALQIMSTGSVNNIMLKKVKIALSLSSEDMLDILQEAGLTISKGELSAVFRKEGHKNYKECGDSYARNFLKGLAMRYRNDNN